MNPGETPLREALLPIQPALDDPTVNEVVCQRPGEVGIDRNGKWEWHAVPEFTFKRLDTIGILAGHSLSLPFGHGHPICLANLPDGQRLTICRPPFVPQGTISMTARNADARENTIDDDDFDSLTADTQIEVERLSSDQELVDLYYDCHKTRRWGSFFLKSVHAGKTIGAIGAMKSGKTHVIRRFMRSLPPEQRLTTIEDTKEFNTLSPETERNRVSLYYGAAGIAPEDAVEVALRTGADRVAVQELRGAEAYALLRLLSIGSTGAFTTWHAEPDDPWTPLALMAKRHPAGREMTSEEIITRAKKLIDIIVYCHRVGNQFSIPHVYFRGAQ